MLIGIVIGAVAHGPQYTMMFIMVFGVTSAGSVFSVHERSHTDNLYGILPLKKSDIVLGRYLFALIIGVVYVAAGAIIGYIMAQFMGGISALGYWATLGIAFTYFCFATSIAYPMYFKFSFAKAYIFVMVPMYIIAVAFLIVTRRTDYQSHLASVIRFFTDHVALAPIFGLLAGLILLAVSATISNLIYTRQEN
ncbi:MAG: ABC-2 transporter permease [Micrococcales bacterium]|nr:ABC-2 transporter permease [Micrococcales bacterium]